MDDQTITDFRARMKAVAPVLEQHSKALDEILAGTKINIRWLIKHSGRPVHTLMNEIFGTNYESLEQLKASLAGIVEEKAWLEENGAKYREAANKVSAFSSAQKQLSDILPADALKTASTKLSELQEFAKDYDARASAVRKVALIIDNLPGYELAARFRAYVDGMPKGLSVPLLIYGQVDDKFTLELPCGGGSVLDGVCDALAVPSDRRATAAIDGRSVYTDAHIGVLEHVPEILDLLRGRGIGLDLLVITTPIGAEADPATTAPPQAAPA